MKAIVYIDGGFFGEEIDVLAEYEYFPPTRETDCEPEARESVAVTKATAILCGVPVNITARIDGYQKARNDLEELVLAYHNDTPTVRRHLINENPGKYMEIPA